VRVRVRVRVGLRVSGCWGVRARNMAQKRDLLRVRVFGLGLGLGLGC